MLKSNLEAYSIEIKEHKQRLDHSSRYKIFSPPCEVCGTLKGKVLHATKENSELK
jgi:2-hydroxy-3-keto-5-methylthiopentenyl-1-phosphate phosphatase